MRDRYSRRVQVAKLVLPLLAIFILSTLFLISGDIDPEGAIPYAKVDVESIAREQRLTNPRLATVGADGASIKLSAAEARPDVDNADQVNANTVLGSIQFKDGHKIEMSAGSALFDVARQTAGLTENVRIQSTLGYDIQTESLVTRVDRAEMTANSEVRAITPYGSLTAGNMSLKLSEEGYRLIFNNKVNLIYEPGAKEN